MAISGYLIKKVKQHCSNPLALKKIFVYVLETVVKDATDASDPKTNSAPPPAVALH